MFFLENTYRSLRMPLMYLKAEKPTMWDAFSLILTKLFI